MARLFRSDEQRRYDLGRAGEDYIRSRLLLGNHLARALDSNRLVSEVFTYLAHPIASDRLTAFETGGTGATQSAWVAVIVDYLLRGPKNVAIAESFEARPEDPVLTERAPYFVFDREVYFLAQEPSTAAVQELLRSMSSYTSIIILTKSERELRNGDRVVESDLDRLSSGVEYVLIGAYDEESFVCGSCAADNAATKADR